MKEYRYLDVHLDNRLDKKLNTEAVYNKGQSKLYFLKKLRSFNVCSKMFHTFFKSVVLFIAIIWSYKVIAIYQMEQKHQSQ